MARTRCHASPSAGAVGRPGGPQGTLSEGESLIGDVLLEMRDLDRLCQQ